MPYLVTELMVNFDSVLNSSELLYLVKYIFNLYLIWNIISDFERKFNLYSTIVELKFNGYISNIQDTAKAFKRDFF